MGKANLVRVAFVRFSLSGKSYPARCDRRDIREGDEVEVLMRADSESPYYLRGIIENIQFERWTCSCRIDNLTSEIKYSFSSDGYLDREVNLSSARIYSVLDWSERKRGYFARKSAFGRNEMQDVYDAVAGDDGEDAYLGDGVWLSSEGSLHDRGI